MTAVMTCDEDNLDRADLVVLLDLSARIVRGAPQDWRTLAVAFRRGADVPARVDALLLLAGPLTDVVEPGDEDVLLRAFLPRLSVEARRKVLTDVREELAEVDRWASMFDRGEVADALDLPITAVHDWVAVAKERAQAFRDSARWVAEAGCLR